MAADDQRPISASQQNAGQQNTGQQNAGEPATGASPRLNVFVSYSRTDTAFADEIVAGLEYDGGFNVFIDRHSIHEGEAWRDRLGGLIASADVIVFLLSKASAASDLCQWETEHAQGLSKRLIPVVIQNMDGVAAPPTLKALHYVRFDEGKSFMAGLAALRRALRADLHWIREHTRLLTRAQEWDAAGRTENRLLSGPDIEAAKQWLDRRPPDAPPPLELHRDYIAASEQAEAARLGEDRRQAEELKQALGRSRVALTFTIVAGALAAAAGIAAGILYFQMRAIGVQAEQAIVDRDQYIQEATAREAQYEKELADLTAERTRLEAALAAAAAQPAGPTPADIEIERLEAQTADLSERLETLIVSRNEKMSVPATPARTAGESAADYTARLERHVAALNDQYLVLLKSSPSRSKRPAPEPYNPSILKQQLNAPRTTGPVAPSGN